MVFETTLKGNEETGVFLILFIYKNRESVRKREKEI